MWAVLVSLVKSEGQWNFLLEVRSELVKQPGEVCFPGGRVEAEETPVDAALRETAEELGIPACDIGIVRELSAEFMTNGREIRPVIGTIREEALSRMTLARDEVADCFLLPVRWLREHPADRFDLAECPDEDLPAGLRFYLARYDSFRRSGKTLYWEYEGHTIWGITARILCRVLKEEFPDQSLSAMRSFQ